MAVVAGLEAAGGLGAGLVGVDAVDGALEAVAGVAGRHLGLGGHLVELERPGPLGHGLVALHGGHPGGRDGRLLDLGVDRESGRGGDLLYPVGAGGQGLRHGVAAQAVLGRALLGRHLGDELGAGLVGVDAVDGAAVGRAGRVGGGGVLPQLDVALGAALDDVAVDVLRVSGKSKRPGVVEGRADEALHGEAGHEALVARDAVLAPEGLEGGAELAARRLVGQAGAHRDAAGVVPVDVVALGGVPDGLGDPCVVGRAGLEDRGAVLDHEGEGGGHDEVFRGVHPRGVCALAGVLVGGVALLREGEHRLASRVVGRHLRPAHRGGHAARADVLQEAYRGVRRPGAGDVARRVEARGAQGRDALDVVLGAVAVVEHGVGEVPGGPVGELPAHGYGLVGRVDARAADLDVARAVRGVDVPRRLGNLGELLGHGRRVEQDGLGAVGAHEADGVHRGEVDADERVGAVPSGLDVGPGEGRTVLGLRGAGRAGGQHAVRGGLDAQGGGARRAREGDGREIEAQASVAGR